MESSIVQVGRRLSLDRLNRIVFGEIGVREGYLVGGFIRDLFLGRACRDRDYVIRDLSSDIVGRIARRTGGGFFDLGRHGLTRIVMGDGATLDFSPLKAPIEEDLMGREAGINSLAWSPRRGILDPAQGLNDLKSRVLRTVKEDNLRRDPVRMLRLFRFVEELGFGIEARTAGYVRRNAALLRTAKSERITCEFFRIVNADDPVDTLKRMYVRGVLGSIILDDNAGLTAGLNVVSNIQGILNLSPVRKSVRLSEELSQGLSRRGFIRLAALLRPTARHNLNLGRILTRRLGMIAWASQSFKGRSCRSRLFDLFDRCGDAAADFLIMRQLTDLLAEQRRYQRILTKPLISAEDICAQWGVCSGPRLGEAIRLVRKGRFMGEIRSRAGAEREVADYLSKGNLT